MSRVSSSDGLAMIAPRLGRSSTSRLWPRRVSAARTAPRVTPKISHSSRSLSWVPGARRWSSTASRMALKTRSSARGMTGSRLCGTPRIVNNPVRFWLTISGAHMRTTLDFCLNGQTVSLEREDPARTLLTWLRESRGLTGTKEGCAEGDYGACTVVLAQVAANGKLEYQPVNACILCLGSLDGKEVLTVESLQDHPVQRAMVDCHGSQCGFCTPGFVMALYGHYKNSEGADLCDALAGNLCRCTGYRPILEAGKRARSLADPKLERADDAVRLKRVAALPRTSTLIGKRSFVPATVAELAQFLVEHPGATILAGGTDVGLWI